MAGVGLTLAEIGTSITNLMLGSLFGVEELVGLAILLFVTFLIIKHGGARQTGVLFIGLSVMVLWLGGTGLYVINGWGEWNNYWLPAWVSGAVIIILLTLFGVGFYKFLRES